MTPRRWQLARAAAAGGHAARAGGTHESRGRGARPDGDGTTDGEGRSATTREEWNELHAALRKKLDELAEKRMKPADAEPGSGEA